MNKRFFIKSMFAVAASAGLPIVVAKVFEQDKKLIIPAKTILLEGWTITRNLEGLISIEVHYDKFYYMANVIYTNLRKHGFFVGGIAHTAYAPDTQMITFKLWVFLTGVAYG